MNAGHVVVHVADHAHGLGNHHAQLHRFPELFRLLHELDELLRLKDGLSLEVIHTGGNLALHLGQLGIHGIAAGRYNSPLGKAGRLSHQIVSAQILSLLQQVDGMNQGDGIQIKHGFGLGMIPHPGVIPGEKKEVVNSKHCRT